MTGILSLNTLIKTMHPKLQDGEYIFAVVTRDQRNNLNPIMTFHENEGTTVIVKKEEALTQGISHESTWSFITLSVHSDLQAIGFLAKITEKLAEAKISVNVVSAFYHDHIFVPTDRAEETMKILKNFSTKN